MMAYPFYVEPLGLYWTVRDSVHCEIDNIPTEQAAQNIANSLNQAYERGKAAVTEQLRRALGISR